MRATHSTKVNELFVYIFSKMLIVCNSKFIKNNFGLNMWFNFFFCTHPPTSIYTHFCTLFSSKIFFFFFWLICLKINKSHTNNAPFLINKPKECLKVLHQANMKRDSSPRWWTLFTDVSNILTNCAHHSICITNKVFFFFKKIFIFVLN